MSTENTSTALTVAQRAVVALGYNEETRKELKALAGKHTHITAITNADGREQVHAAMMVLKNTRIAIEKRGKTAREDANAFSAAVIREEKALKDLIYDEEDRLCALRDEWDAQIEAARQAKIRAEEERAANIEAGIAELRGCQTLMPSSGSTLIAEHIADLEKLPTDAAFFEDRIQQAIDAKAAGLARLHQLHEAAIAHESEQKRIADERAELARLRAEQEARDKAERARRAAEDAELQRKREAEAAAERERIRKEREALEAEQAAARARQRAEEERIAAERRVLQEQQRAQRESEERAAREKREAEEARERASAPPAPTTVETLGGALVTHIGDERPSFEEIVRAVAFHFETDEDTVRDWICENVVLGAQGAA